MRWWLATRRPGGIAIAVVLFIALVWVTGSSATIPLPSILDASTASVPLTVFSPLVIVAAIHRSLDGPDRIIESGTVRPIATLEAAFIAGVALTAAGIAILIGGSNGFVAGRSLLLYLGIGLVVSAVADDRAFGMLPLAVAVLSGPLGARSNGQPELWAVPLLEASSAVAATMSIGVFAAGLFLRAHHNRVDVSKLPFSALWSSNSSGSSASA